MSDEVKQQAIKEALDKARAGAGGESEEIVKSSVSFANISLSQAMKEAPLDVCAEIIKKTYVTKTKDGNKYLTREQAAAAAIYGYEELGSPFAILKNQMWMNPDNGRISLSVEGLMHQARKDNLNLGVPKFERIPADLSKPVEAVRTTIKIGDDEISTLIDRSWAQKTPLWETKTEWMMQVRGVGNCIKMARGYGISEDLTEPPSLFQQPEVKSLPPKQFTHPQLSPSRPETVDAELVEVAPIGSKKEKR